MSVGQKFNWPIVIPRQDCGLVPYTRARVCPKDVDLQVDSRRFINRTTRFELVESRFVEPSFFRTSRTKSRFPHFSRTLSFSPDFSNSAI